MEIRKKRISMFLNGMFAVPLVSKDCRADSYFTQSFAAESELDSALENFRERVQDEFVEKVVSLDIPTKQIEHDGGTVSKAVALWRVFDEETERSAFPLDIVLLNPLDWNWPDITDISGMREEDALRFSEFKARLFSGVRHFAEPQVLSYEHLKKAIFSNQVPRNTCFITPSRNIRFAIKEDEGSPFVLEEEKGAKGIRIEYSLTPRKAELVGKYEFMEKAPGGAPSLNIM